MPQVRLQVKTLGDLIKSLHVYYRIASTRSDTWPRTRWESFQAVRIEEILLEHFGVDTAEDLEALPSNTPVSSALASRVVAVLN